MKAPFWFSPACFRLTLFPIQDLQRCDQEIAAAKDALLAGHPEVEGLALALRDWSEEKRLRAKDDSA